MEYNYSKRISSIKAIIIVFIQPLGLIVPITHTEKALKKTFDQDGSRR